MSSKVIIRNERLTCLKPVLKEWVKLNARFGREWATVKDAPWWYNERASVSLLAGAIWRCKGDAFEEFSEEKRGLRDRREGRIDLWFALRGKQFNAEAKQCWIQSDLGQASVNWVTKTMSRARTDAHDCIPDGRPRLAIVFGVFLVKQDLLPQLNEQMKLMDEIATNKSLSSGAMAYVFPKLKTLPISGEYALPGVAVWIQEVRRRPRKQ